MWTWHGRMAEEGTWDTVLATLTAAADAEIVIDWSVSVDSTIARAHQHARNTTRLTGGWIERQGIRVKSPPTTASGAHGAG
ncbi:transposase [Micrococcus sp. 116]|nr:transposase [Micrococcus sp. 116]